MSLCGRERQHVQRGSADKNGRPNGPLWPFLPPQLIFLRQLTLTECQRLDVEDVKALASGCPALVALHLHRGPETAEAIYPRAPDVSPLSLGTTSSDRGPVRHGDWLGQRQAPATWALSGLTFAPLAACVELQEIELHDTQSPNTRPTGLPPGALLSLGVLTRLRGLALCGAAADVDLCSCLSHLLGLTRLDLALLPYAWETCGIRRRAARAPSLARHTLLRALRLRQLAEAAGGGGGAGRAGHATAASESTLLPRELYDMLLSANHSSLQVLQLDLPPLHAQFHQPAAAADAAAGGHGCTVAAAQHLPVGRLAPRVLACGPELLEALLRGGMSLRRLEALQLRSWRPLGNDRRRPLGVRWRDPRLLPLRPSRHLDENLAQRALRRVAAASMEAAANGGGGATAGDDAGGGGAAAAAVYDLLPPGVHAALATEATPRLARERSAVGHEPAVRLQERLRVRVSVAETLCAAEEMAFRLHLQPTSQLGPDRSGRIKCYEFLSTANRTELDLVILDISQGGDVLLGGAGVHVLRNLGPGGLRRANAQPPPRPPVQAFDPAGRAAALAAAGAAAWLSDLARPLQWLPYKLPDLYGLSLPYNAVDEHGVALLAAGLTALRWLALGRVELSYRGVGGLKPLGSLRSLTSLRFGEIICPIGGSIAQAPAAPASTPAAAAAAAAATPEASWTWGAGVVNNDGEANDDGVATAAVLRELCDCCMAFVPPLPPLPLPPMWWQSTAQSSLSPRPLPMPVVAAAGGPVAAAATAVVVVVPPPCVSFAHALKLNRRLEAAAAAAAAAACGCSGGDDARGSRCAPGPAAQLSLHERGLVPDSGSDWALDSDLKPCA